MRAAFVILAILSLSACTSLLLGNSSTGETAGGAARSAGQTGADSTISGAVRSALSADPELSGYAIGIRTVSGDVTLSGTVGSYPARDRAVQIAAGTKGVIRVDNRLVVNTNL
jgi:osmotically-inducible protein OsmY